MPRYIHLFIRYVLLAFALLLAGFLVFAPNEEIGVHCNVVFVLDMHTSMDTVDVAYQGTKISRLDAAKHIMITMLSSQSQCTYGLILFGDRAEYLLPPTFDTGTFLQYLSGISETALSGNIKNFAILSGMLDSDALYVVLSDFAHANAVNLHWPSSVALRGIGTLLGSDARDDIFAHTFGFDYTAIDTIDSFSSDAVLMQRFDLAPSQRLLLYAVLGILVVVALLL